MPCIRPCSFLPRRKKRLNTPHTAARVENGKRVFIGRLMKLDILILVINRPSPSIFIINIIPLPLPSLLVLRLVFPILILFSILFFFLYFFFFFFFLFLQFFFSPFPFAHLACLFLSSYFSFQTIGSSIASLF